MNNFKNESNNPNKGESMKALTSTVFNEAKSPRNKKRGPYLVERTIDMTLLNTTVENMPLKEMKEYNYQIDKKIVYAFKFQRKTQDDIVRDLAITKSYVVYCLKRHKISIRDRYEVLGAWIVKYTRDGLSYQDICEKLGISINQIITVKNFYNLTRTRKKALLEKKKKKIESKLEVKEVRSEKEIILKSMDFSEIEKIFKSTTDAKVKELAKQKLKLIFECL